ncbi:hypothetical protein TRVA0_006S03620 [Trichomonascus vanleenenianus]|uniref:DNA topoisomerase (ATP-hydrolyzing) n=1 Tax=Trichomonascus vanleenenianus TaxID=2268995 RepID=UPI003ECA7990
MTKSRQIRERIVNILGSVRQDVLNGNCPEIGLATNKRHPDGSKQEKAISLFDGRKNIRRFVVHLAVLYFILQALDSGQVVTERDIYYKDVTLFKRQSNVTRAIQSIANTLEVSRRDLNVTASAKGLVCGDMTVFGIRGEVADIRRNDGPQLLAIEPEFVRLHEIPRYILVIEKDAVFKQIAADGSFDRALCVTGKGFPDLITRETLAKISIAYPSIPMYGLVDADPYGIQILGTYLFGSSRFKENSRCLHITHIGLSLLRARLSELIPLTNRDRRYAISMLKNRSWIENVRDLKRQLQRMLFFNAKAELNGNKSVLEIVSDIINAVHTNGLTES